LSINVLFLYYQRPSKGFFTSSTRFTVFSICCLFKILLNFLAT
jgi:hypothetical protein